jgi:hypothetical protein
MQSRRHNRRPEETNCRPNGNQIRQNSPQEMVHNLQRQHQAIGLRDTRRHELGNVLSIRQFHSTGIASQFCKSISFLKFPNKI